MEDQSTADKNCGSVPRPPRLPRAIWALGFVSLFMDISSEIVHSLLPVFLVSGLGASYTTVGFIEGAGEATALLFKFVSGPISDWWGRRKPLALAGYAMGAFSKPLFALAPSPPFVLIARVIDRVGKGLRGAPRDALVAELSPVELRGRAFGLRQALDNVGAVIGPLAAIFLLQLFDGDFRLVFWVASLPGLLAVVVLFKGVQEPETKARPRDHRLYFAGLKKLGPAFWIVVLAGGVFQLARFSEAFLILRAREAGLRLEHAPLVLVAMNVIYAMTSYPVGWLSDRVRREWPMAAGIAVLLVADLVLARANSLELVFFGVALWGLHLGLTQGTLAAYVADTCPGEYRGTAFGIFNLCSALALMLASTLSGWLWDRHGSSVSFGVAAALAAVTLLAWGGWRLLQLRERGAGSPNGRRHLS